MANVQIEKIKNAGLFLKEVFDQWNKDRATRMGAALAYYTIFSITPLLIVAIALAGFFFGQDAAEGRIVREIQGLLGKEGALAIQEMIKSVRKPDTNIIATVVGIGTLLLGATGVFTQIQDSLNSIWGVEPDPKRGWGDIIRERLGSFTMVFGTGFLLLVSLLIDAVLSAFTEYISRLLGSHLSVYLLKVTNFSISFFIITLLFGMIYKVLPDVDIDWKDVGLGAVVTSILFIIGKFAISLYLGNSNIGAAYGAAGTMIVMLVWIFYASLIFLFGAEFTQIYTKKYGKRIRTTHGAIIVDATKHKQPDKKAIDPETRKKERQIEKQKKKELSAIPLNLENAIDPKIEAIKENNKSPVITLTMAVLGLFLSKYTNSGKNSN